MHAAEVGDKLFCRALWTNVLERANAPIILDGRVRRLPCLRRIGIDNPSGEYLAESGIPNAVRIGMVVACEGR